MTNFDLTGNIYAADIQASAVVGLCSKVEFFLVSSPRTKNNTAPTMFPTICIIEWKSQNPPADSETLKKTRRIALSFYLTNLASGFIEFGCPNCFETLSERLHYFDIYDWRTEPKHSTYCEKCMTTVLEYGLSEVDPLYERNVLDQFKRIVEKEELATPLDRLIHSDYFVNGVFELFKQVSPILLSKKKNKVRRITITKNGATVVYYPPFNPLWRG